jgi:hypothetical protein
MSTQNPYESPIQPSQIKPPGEQFAPCPACRGTSAKRLNFTFWGGAIGPRLLTHVRCDQCGTTYNGKTGKSNLTAIIVYQVVLLALGIALIVAVRFIVEGHLSRTAPGWKS